MRRPRMTTRGWMIVVALVAVGLGVRGFVKRVSYRARRAGYHREREKICRRIMAEVESGRITWSNSFEFAEQHRRLLPYPAAMRRQCESAVRHPWLPIEPDLPDPELQPFSR